MNITKVAGYVGAVYGSLELYSDMVKDLMPRKYRGSVLLSLCVVIVLYEHYKDLRRKHRER
jgi:hypothetical protein